MQVGLKAFDVVVDEVDRKKMWVAKKGRSLQRSLMLGFEVPLLAQKKLLNS